MRREPPKNFPQFETPIEVDEPVQDAVSLLQAKVAMQEAGILPAIDAAIMASNDERLKLAWVYGTVVERNGYVAVAAAKFGISEAQLDALFAVAKTVDFSDADGLIDHDSNPLTPEVEAKGWWATLLSAVGFGRR